MKNSKKKEKKFNARLILLPDGSIKVTGAERYRKVNQYRGEWEICDSRQLARVLNKSKIIIK